MANASDRNGLTVCDRGRHVRHSTCSGLRQWHGMCTELGLNGPEQSERHRAIEPKRQVSNSNKHFYDRRTHIVCHTVRGGVGSHPTHPVGVTSEHSLHRPVLLTTSHDASICRALASPDQVLSLQAGSLAAIHASSWSFTDTGPWTGTIYRCWTNDSKFIATLPTPWTPLVDRR